VENSTWVFDEFMQVVWEEIPELLQRFKEPLLEAHQGGIIEDLYDVWYYYINSPTMRYVNNYYEYEKYDPRLFKKNIEKAIHYLCKLEQERIINSTREILSELSDYTEENPVYDMDLNRVEIYFVWVAEPGCCPKCRALDGRILENTSQFTTHWNCRCHLEQHVKLLSPEGEIISDDVKML